MIAAKVKLPKFERPMDSIALIDTGSHTAGVKIVSFSLDNDERRGGMRPERAVVVSAPRPAR